MTYRHSKDATVAAAKSGFSRATGYRIEDDPRLPSPFGPLRCSTRSGGAIRRSAPAFGARWNGACAGGEPWPAPSRM